MTATQQQTCRFTSTLYKSGYMYMLPKHLSSTGNKIYQLISTCFIRGFFRPASLATCQILHPFKYTWIRHLMVYKSLQDEQNIHDRKNLFPSQRSYSGGINTKNKKSTSRMYCSCTRQVPLLNKPERVLLPHCLKIQTAHTQHTSYLQHVHFIYSNVINKAIIIT